jgi:2-dehydropantoate 2-reductase
MTRIAVYGAGGVGGYFGGRLARAGAEVHVLARGAHLRARRAHGLKVRSVKGDFRVRVQATGDPAGIGPCDVVLFCVKTFGTGAAAARLGPLPGDGTAVVSLQNGVENEEKPARAAGEEHVMGGAAFIFAGIAGPGVIVHAGGPAGITFGELDGRAARRARGLLAWCERAGFQAELPAGITAVLWARLAFICAQAGMTAAVRLPIRGDPRRRGYPGRLSAPGRGGMRRGRGGWQPRAAGRPGQRPGPGAGHRAGQLLIPA